MKLAIVVMLAIVGMVVVPTSSMTKMPTRADNSASRNKKQLLASCVQQLAFVRSALCSEETESMPKQSTSSISPLLVTMQSVEATTPGLLQSLEDGAVLTTGEKRDSSFLDECCRNSCSFDDFLDSC